MINITWYTININIGIKYYFSFIYQKFIGSVLVVLVVVSKMVNINDEDSIVKPAITLIMH